MCIRDRSGIILLANFADIIHGICVEYNIVRKFASFLRKDCLLYTSDAADERSSVDLGGRRIIKKKTLANLQGHRTTKLKKKCT